MKVSSVRNFRSGLSDYTKKGDLVILTNHGRIVGCFLPLSKTDDIPMEFRKEFVAGLGGALASQLGSNKARDKEILSDFKDLKKTRR